MDDRFPGGSEPQAPPPYLGGGAAGGGQMSDRMQSMLARAAEEQMAEQRQLQVLVNDVRSSLTQLQQDVRQTAGAATIELMRGEVNGLGAEVRTSSTQLGERLEAVVRAVTASVQAAQSVGSQLETMHQQVAQQQAAVAGLPALVQRAVVDATPVADVAVPAEVASLRTELTALRAEVAQLRASTADVVREEVAALRDEVRGTSSSVVAALVSHREATRSEVDDSFRRLGSQMDESVLALAEAMLRRRPTSAMPAAALNLADEAVAPASAPPPAVTDEAPAALGGDDLGHVPAVADPIEATDAAAAPDVDEPVVPAADDRLLADGADDPEWADDEPDWARAGEAAEPEAAEPEAAEPEAAVAATPDADDPADVPADVPADDPADEDADVDDDTETAEAEVGAADAEATGDAGERRLGTWFGGDDQPQAAFTLGEGWERPGRRNRSGEAADAEADTDSEAATDGEAAGDGEPTERDRRRPWWRPGG